MFRAGLLPSVAGPPQQHIGVAYSNEAALPASETGPRFYQLFYQHSSWPVVLILHARFFDFCYRLFLTYGSVRMRFAHLSVCGVQVWRLV